MIHDMPLSRTLCARVHHMITEELENAISEALQIADREATLEFRIATSFVAGRSRRRDASDIQLLTLQIIIDLFRTINAS